MCNARQGQKSNEATAARSNRENIQNVHKKYERSLMAAKALARAFTALACSISLWSHCFPSNLKPAKEVCKVIPLLLLSSNESHSLSSTLRFLQSFQGFSRSIDLICSTAKATANCETNNPINFLKSGKYMYILSHLV